MDWKQQEKEDSYCPEGYWYRKPGRLVVPVHSGIDVYSISEGWMNHHGFMIFLERSIFKIMRFAHDFINCIYIKNKVRLVVYAIFSALYVWAGFLSCFWWKVIGLYDFFKKTLYSAVAIFRFFHLFLLKCVF